MSKNELLLDSPERYRSFLSALSNKVYMNFGAQGTMADQTLEAITKAYADVQRQGPLSMSMFGTLTDNLSQTRQELSLEFKAPSQSFALTQSTTDGCNIVLWGTNWSPGDHLLLSDSEHPGVVAAALQLARRLKLELTFFPAAGLSRDRVVDTVCGALKPGSKLVVLSHVLWNTGEVLPVEEITAACRERGVRVLIDGAQSAGVLPLNLEQSNLDYYAMTGHKWLGGPDGVGALYVNNNVLEELEPTFVGWRGSLMQGPTELRGWEPGAPRFEVSTSPFPLLNGLRSGLQLSRQYATPNRRYEMILSNARHLREKLSELPGIRLLTAAAQSGLVSFAIDRVNHKEVALRLEKEQIIVRTIPTPDCLRASLHWFTSEKDIDLLTDALQAVCSGAVKQPL